MLTREALTELQQRAFRTLEKAKAAQDDIGWAEPTDHGKVTQGTLNVARTVTDLALLLRHTIGFLEPAPVQPAQSLGATEPPVLSVAVDVDGDAWQRRADGRWYAAMDGGGDESWSGLRDKYYPITVVYLPEEG